MKTPSQSSGDLLYLQRQPAQQLFEVRRRDDYPPLAWLVELRDRPLAHLGKDVEVFADGFVEGCWPEAFFEFGILHNPNLFGSGMLLQDGKTWFCPPAHTVDCLFAVEHLGRRLVSNSLFLIFLESGVALDTKHNYTKRLFTVAYGIDEADDVLYRSSTTTIYRILYDDFTFGKGKPVRRRKPPITRPLNDFSAYKAYLIKVLRGCAENAQDAKRGRRYGLLSMSSSGYDANTAAALAKEVGATRAVTVGVGRGGHNDSGLPATQPMGLECVERARPVPGTEGAMNEIEFLMSGAGGADYPISAFHDLLGGTLLLSGHLGDKLWGEPHAKPSTDLSRGDNAGNSLSEYRLRTGFLLIPVPYIAAMRHPDVLAITQSQEMDPWRIGGDYDRPIPRRIIEEAGAPRESFGQQKRAMALIFSWGPMYLSPQARRSFNAFLRQEGGLAKVYGRHTTFSLGNVAFRLVRKSTEKVKSLKEPLSGVLGRLHKGFRAHENSPYANLLFIWSMREALAKHPKRPSQS